MNRNSNIYTVIYATVLTILVAVGLAFAAMGLKPQQTENAEKEQKMQVLNAISSVLPEAPTFDNAAALWEQLDMDANMFVVNAQGEKVEGKSAFDLDTKTELAKGENANLPVYQATIDGKTYYVMGMYGAGLWGPVWGYLAVEGDGNTIAGATFDHASETAGLGAKIKDDPNFAQAFIGKKLFVNGDFRSIAIVKKGKEPKDGTSYIDAISGATLTCNGVSEMIKKSIEGYLPYLKTLMTSTACASQQTCAHADGCQAEGCSKDDACDNKNVESEKEQ